MTARKFLQLIDAGKLSETWPKTGPILHGMVTQPGWEAAVRALRKGTGTFKGRDLMLAGFTPKIDGAPDGHYFVIFFVSRFERGKFEEKVILNRTKARWDVEGYFITPITAARP